MNIKQDTIIRTVVLVVALVNQFMTMRGLNPIPFSDEEIGEMLSYAFTVIAAMWAWWKNNSFTKDAIKADEVLAQLKKGSE